jgi:hypothetical protein
VQRAAAGRSFIGSAHFGNDGDPGVLTVDFATEELLLRALEAGHVRIFNSVIGLIQDLKDVTGKVSADHEKCLRLPLILFDAAVKSRS